MRSLARSTLPTATVALGLTTAVVAGATLTKTGSSRVEFRAKGPVGMTIIGRTRDLEVSDSRKTLVVKVPLRNLKTGIGLRDRHMKEKYLEVDRYPDARLSVAHSALQFPGKGATLEASAIGRFTLHGVSRNVHFRYKAKGKSNGYRIEGLLHVNMHDYGIRVPSYLGVTVKPDVAVKVQFQLADR